MSLPHAEPRYTKTFTVSELAKRIGGVVRGAGDVSITGLNALADARDRELTFISSAPYAKLWPTSKAASAVVKNGLEPASAVPSENERGPARPLIFVNDAEIAMIQLLELFQNAEAVPELGVHPSAVMHPSAVIGKQVRIGPHVSVDARALIGDGVVLHAGVRIYADVSVGAGSILHGNVVIRQNCKIGRGVLCHQNVSIGPDGFGYRPDPAKPGLLKVPHLGNVIVEDGVEIGANTCIDRAKFGSTIIGAGTKIDNLCQIAHNCRIGRCCVIAGGSIIAGSVEIGDGAILGAAPLVIDHISIGKGAQIGAAAFVTRDVPAGERWIGYPAEEAQAVLRQWASIRKLPDLLKRVARHFQSPER